MKNNSPSSYHTNRLSGHGLLTITISLAIVLCAPRVRGYSDDFNRANEALENSANWMRVQGSITVSGAAISGGATAIYRYVGEVGDDQYVQTTVTTSYNLGIGALRLPASGLGGYAGQCLGEYVRILKINPNGTFATLCQVATGQLTQAGDTYRLEAVGHTLVLKRNGILLATVVDATYPSGAVGMSGADKGVAADDWQGGTCDPGSGGEPTTCGYPADPFNRIDEPLEASPIWKKLQGSLVVAGTKVSGSVDALYYFAHPLTDDQYVQTTLRTSNWAGGGAVRIPASGKGGYTYQVAPNYIRIVRINADGTFTYIGATGEGIAIANGDIIRLEIVGNRLLLKQNDLLIATVVDSIYTSGYAGICGAGKGVVADDWQAGNSMASENFDRPDEYLEYEEEWTRLQGAIDISSGIATGSTDAIYYHDRKLTNNQYAQVRHCAVYDNGGYAAVRIPGPTLGGYGMQSASNYVRIFRINADGTFTVLRNINTGAPTLANDVLRIEAIDSRLTAWRNGIYLGEVSDDTYSMGHAGIASGGKSIVVDDFECGSLLTTPVTADASLLPFAYYPYPNELEVAFDAAAVGAAIGVDTKVTVAVYPAGGATSVFAGEIYLDELGLGSKRFALPALDEGDYEVEYEIGSTVVTDQTTFSIQHFSWEHNSLGLNHDVYAPFVPVTIDGGGRAVVVGRKYSMNFLGCFDQVECLGTDLLAQPMRLVVNTSSGEQIWSNLTCNGSVIYADLAVFNGSAKGTAMCLTSTARIEEDGCVKVQWSLLPGTTQEEVQSAYLDISFGAADVPLFHYCATRGVRLNYGGDMPDGDQIVWDFNCDDHPATNVNPAPTLWYAQAGSQDSVLWNSSQYVTWGQDLPPFVPYLWLGTTDRGLAWFAENTSGFAVDGVRPVQELIRDGSRRILRIHLIQQPTVIREPRTVVFGLQASPTKPMEPDHAWQTRRLNTGFGPVLCWGGYICASMYPDAGDYSIIDKIQEARYTGVVDSSWFDARAQSILWPSRPINGDDTTSWRYWVSLFANRASYDSQRGTYFEEQAVDSWQPEYPIYLDEWEPKQFSRFHPSSTDNPWIVYPPSYIDFAVYHANEWLRRDVGLYFDNHYNKASANRFESRATIMPDRSVMVSDAIWQQRDYMKRVWKLARKWNLEVDPTVPYSFDYGPDITIHMTNTNIIPVNTWADASYDTEQPYRNDPLTGEPLPFPPGYLRAITMGRQAGLISHVIEPLHNSATGRDATDELLNLTEWGMRRVHEIRPNTLTGLALQYEQKFIDFGYGAANVASHNYWDSALVSVDDNDIKWLALQRDYGTFKGFLVLQSYQKAAASLTLTFLGATSFTDVQTLEVIPVTNGTASIEIPANYGTRAFEVTIP